MKICIDARNIKNKPCGLGNYASSLLRFLMKYDEQNEYIVILDASLKDNYKLNNNFKIVKIPYDIVSLRNIFLFHRVINRIDPDVYHSLHAFLPCFVSKKIKKILTIHDLKQLLASKISQKNFLRALVVNSFYKLFQKQSLKIANSIIAISNTTNLDIIKLFDKQFVSKTIVLTHSLADTNTKLEKIEGLQNNEAVSSLVLSFVNNNKFVLSLGNSKPHKNIDSCIYIFKRLKETIQNFDLKLAIVGRDDRKNVLKNLVKELKLENDVFFFNQTNDEERNEFYKKALFLAFPSKYEGLGMPILEAMKFNTPVLTSNITATKEIAGDAALLVDPYNIESVYDGFYKLITDEKTRLELVEKGKNRLNLFSWDNYASSLLKLYKE